MGSGPGAEADGDREAPQCRWDALMSQMRLWAPASAFDELAKLQFSVAWGGAGRGARPPSLTSAAAAAGSQGAEAWPGRGLRGLRTPPSQALRPGTQQLEGGVAFPGGAEQSHTEKRGAPDPARGRHSQGRISVQNVTFPGFFDWSGGSRLGPDGRRRSWGRGMWVSSGVTWGTAVWVPASEPGSPWRGLHPPHSGLCPFP